MTAWKSSKVVTVLTLVALFFFYQNAITPDPVTDSGNVLVIYLDDLDSISFYDALEANLLPNIRTEIYNQGLNFKNSFVTFSLCCPSRASYLTGLYPHNHQVLDVGGPKGGYSQYFKMGHTRNNLPNWLKQRGYTTGLIGKMMNGVTSRTKPPEDWDYFSALTSRRNYCMDDYAFREKGFNGQIKNDEYSIKTHPAGVPYQTRKIMEKSLQFIQEARARGNPFFLSINPTAPHLEYDCSKRAKGSIRPEPQYLGRAIAAGLYLDTNKPSFNEADIRDKSQFITQKFRKKLSASEIERLQKIYLDRIDSLISVDELVGEVIRALRQSNLYEKTTLIFTSDNGFMLGEHRMGYKILPYEESIRVPLLIKPAGSSMQREVFDLVINNDLAPTIADLALAGSQARNCDGRSLKPILAGGAMPIPRKRFLIENPLEGSGDTRYPFAFYAVRELAPNQSQNRMSTFYFRAKKANEFHPESYDLNRDPLQLESDYPSLIGTSPWRETHRSLMDLKGCRSQFDSKVKCFDVENR